MDWKKETYHALLESPSWKVFRKEFIVRKGFTCQRCGKSLKSGLQVHHRRYYAGAKPWEYADSELQCLCVDCHRDLHLELAQRGEKIPVYDREGKKVELSRSQTCFRCAGEGIREEFTHILGGLCFHCFGTGIRGIHRYSAFEARKLSLRIWHDYLKKHEIDGKFYNLKTLKSRQQAEEWLLSINRKVRPAK